MSNRIERERSFLDIGDFFFQCLNENAQFIKFGVQPFYFPGLSKIPSHLSLNEDYRKIPPFHPPVNFEPHRAERVEHREQIC
jgi:hypothetical protein